MRSSTSTQRRRWTITILTLALAALVVPMSAPAWAGGQHWPTVVRDGEWHLLESHAGGPATRSWRFGEATDVPFFGDWDGDGTATPGVYRDGTWLLSNDLGDGEADVQFYYGGRAGDVPMVGDWNGDGIDTVGVVRDGVWHLVNHFRGGAADLSFTYGRVGPRGDDVPLVGDWDGDGQDTVGIVRDGEWHLRDANAGGSGDRVFVYGRVGPRGDDVAIIGDWDGDGVDTVGVVRDAIWHLRNAHAGGAADVTFGYGDPTDLKIVQRGTRPDPAGMSPTDGIRAWFPDMAEKAISVADCESGLNPEAVNPRGFHGLFQISERYHRERFRDVTGVSWDEGIYVSYYNAQYARDLHDRVGDWSPWPECGS